MSQAVSVASVLLVAEPSRVRALQPWLRVLGEPVSYSVDTMAPADVSERGTSWDVIVIDGESVATRPQRVELFRRLRHPAHRFASSLYVCQRLYSPGELEHALAHVDDAVAGGWELGEPVRRRVQMVALASWRHEMSRRSHPRRQGPARLRLVRGQQANTNDDRARPQATKRQLRRLDRAFPLVLVDRASQLGPAAGIAQELVMLAFHEGRRVGVTSMNETAGRICQLLKAEMQRTRDALRPDDVAEMETRANAAEGSAVVDARFAGAEAALTAVAGEIHRLGREELDAIERRDVRPAGEP